MSVSQPSSSQAPAGASNSAQAAAAVAPLTFPPVSPSLSEILVQSSQRFDELTAELDEIDQTPVQTHVDALTALPPSVVYGKISTLEKWALNLGFEEGNCNKPKSNGLGSSAGEMKRGRELDVFGAPPPAVSEVLQQHQQQAQQAASQLQASQQAQFQALKTALEAMYGKSNTALLAALQQSASAAPTQPQPASNV